MISNPVTTCGLRTATSDAINFSLEIGSKSQFYDQKYIEIVKFGIRPEFMIEVVPHSLDDIHDVFQDNKR